MYPLFIADALRLLTLVDGWRSLRGAADSDSQDHDARGIAVFTRGTAAASCRGHTLCTDDI